jgi:asparagine synthase (glutamine-hydrolysing)
VATHVARRHGLAEPVPASFRYTNVPEAEESTWQDLVLDHLGLAERELVDITDEQDALGPAATRALRDHGVRWPGNAYMHVPILELARGGSLLTGVGGDELFASRGARFLLVAHGQERPRPRDVLSLALAVAPRGLRRVVVRRRLGWAPEWLTSAGRKGVERALAREEVAWPHRWDETVAYWAGSRAFAALRHTLPTLARPYDLQVTNPLMEPAVLAELVRTGGPTGFPSRADAMTRLFGDLLPPAALTRRTKAAFSGAVWGPRAREFAREWDGGGIDPDAVDAPALREEWLASTPNFTTVLLLHTAWLHAAGHPMDQPIAPSS